MAEDQQEEPPNPRPAAPKGTNTSAFRNVSACERCRKRKNRCDKRFPQCTLCFKAGVKCIGFDPITGQSVPRSYVHHLETRCEYLEGLLRRNGIPFADGETFAYKSVDETPQPDLFSGDAGFKFDAVSTSSQASERDSSDDALQRQNSNKSDHNDLNNLFESVGMNSARGTSSRNLTSASGISFTRICAAAIKSTTTISTTKRKRQSSRVENDFSPTEVRPESSMRDSAFGLHTRPSSRPSAFPERQLALKLFDLYFNYIYPQFPILHKGQFLAMMESVYEPQHKRSSRENFLLNIVFAIGSGVILDPNDNTNYDQQAQAEQYHSTPKSDIGKRRRMSTRQHQPEEYHAAAILHLEAFLGSCSPKDQGPFGGLEELQGVLLLACFALLRPIAPGLWYIVGVAVRLALDLKLHHEDDFTDDQTMGNRFKDSDNQLETDSINAYYTQDMRRRLFWCTYSLDRLVSSCVGRPYSISDHMVSTQFPSLMDDGFIQPDGILSAQWILPTPKLISYHYFRLRLLQSEILHVLQHFTAQRAMMTHTSKNKYMHTNLSSPYLENHSSLYDWRRSMDKKLFKWKQEAPAPEDTGVQFSPLFWDLNYWQAVLMLFRTSLVAPSELFGEAEMIEGEMSTPPPHVGNDSQEAPDLVYLKIAQAGREVIKLYVELQKQFLVNYTYLATHHLFMGGVSFLYALWHSRQARERLSVAAIEKTIQAAALVFTGLVAKCPPAKTCRDALMRIGNETIKRMVLADISESAPVRADDHTAIPRSHPKETEEETVQSRSRLPAQEFSPQFDIDFSNLFADTGNALPSFGRLQQLPPSFQSARANRPSDHASAAHAVVGEGSASQSSEGFVSMPGARDPADDPKLTALGWSNPHTMTDANIVFDQFNLEDMDIDPSMLDVIGEPLGFGSTHTDAAFAGSDLPTDLLPGGETGAGLDLLDQFWFGSGPADTDEPPDA